MGLEKGQGEGGMTGETKLSMTRTELAVLT